jgi:hypothetical protein
MKLIIIVLAMLCAVSVSAQDLIGTPSGSMSTGNSQNLIDNHILKWTVMDDGSVIKLNEGSLKDMIEFRQEQVDIIFKDLSLSKNICFEIDGDSKRCVNAKWLYLLMVAADIKEVK